MITFFHVPGVLSGTVIGPVSRALAVETATARTQRGGPGCRSSWVCGWSSALASSATVCGWWMLMALSHTAPQTQVTRPSCRQYLQRHWAISFLKCTDSQCRQYSA
jgi:hypothetical protein